MTMKEFKPFVAELIDAGWKMQIPDRETYMTHDEACNNGVCEKCGHKGLCYMPLVGPASKKFRAFSICQKCQNVKEL